MQAYAKQAGSQAWQAWQASRQAIMGRQAGKQAPGMKQACRHRQASMASRQAISRQACVQASKQADRQ